MVIEDGRMSLYGVQPVYSRDLLKKYILPGSEHGHAGLQALFACGIQWRIV